jgi:nuclear GTP-binding protein
MKSSNKCIGASTLMGLLSNYCRKHDIKTSITVGIVGKDRRYSKFISLQKENIVSGFPNVGKSSVINSLKRSQACETGSMPGITK